MLATHGKWRFLTLNICHNFTRNKPADNRRHPPKKIICCLLLLEFVAVNILGAQPKTSTEPHFTLV